MRTLLKLILPLALLASVLLWGINVVFATEQLSHVAILGLQPASVPYLARVDLSTVTPLVLVLTLIAVTRGVWRLDRWVAAGKDPRQLWRPHFPFPLGLRSLLIQLGLLGTIFAFIVAFNDLATSAAAKEASYNPAVLIAPLGTALWSTFAGIAFAFLVLPPVEAWFSRAMRAAEPGSGEMVAEVNAVGAAMESLAEKGLASAKALERLEAEVEALQQSLGGAQKVRDLVVALQEVLALLHIASGEMTAALLSTRDALVVLPEPLREMTLEMRAIGAELDLERQATRSLEQSLTGSALSLAALVDSQRGMPAISTGLSSLGGSLRLLTETLREAPPASTSAPPTAPQENGELAALRSDLARIEVDVRSLVRGLARGPVPPSLLHRLSSRLQAKRTVS